MTPNAKSTSPSAASGTPAVAAISVLVGLPGPSSVYSMDFVGARVRGGGCRFRHRKMPAGAPLLRGAAPRGGRGQAAVALLLLCGAAAAAVALVGAGRRSSGLLEVPARTPMLSYLLGKDDPPWVAAGQQPLQYFEAQSRVKDTKNLEYWPGISFSDVRPNLNEERPPLEGTVAWAPGNGYGIELMNSKDGTVFSGDPVLKHGFMGQMCASSDECQNADVCKDGKCKPAIFDGMDAVEASVKAAEAKKWPQAKSFGQQQLRAQMQLLREIDSQTAADEKQLGLHAARTPHRRHVGTLHSANYKLSAEEERKQEDSIFDEPAPSRTLHRAAKRASTAKKAAAARFQGLAMGGGTPVDLTFGVGQDGEPPYHLQTVAESVRNGLLDPNAPDVLPYTQVGGSGTTGQMTAVGYMQPLPAAQDAPADIKGTVEEAA